MKCSDQLDKLAAALAQFQAHMPRVVKESSVNTGKYRFTYADLPSILESIREEMGKAGLALVQTLSAEGTLDTTLLHASGQWISGSAILPVGPSSTPQETGSAISYFRRYGATAILGIAADEDDDGQAAARQPQQRAQPTSGGVVSQKAGEPPRSKPATPPEDFESLKRALEQTAPGPDGRIARLTLGARVAASQKAKVLSAEQAAELRTLYTAKEKPNG